ncbi:MAG TPA: acyl carrier protein, partial [Polyangiaceae bacterium]|nr:acyl carrier protein [Polyangiaceae bacterium]
AQFEFALSTVELSTPAELAALDANDVADAFAAYARTIGDLDDDHSAEPPDAPPPMGYWEPMSGMHAVAVRSTRDATATTPFSRAEMADFIINWLSRRVRIPASKIERTRSFADHGFDSMAAVELAKALSDKLGKTFDETLLWNFATIDDLLDHLEAISATTPSKAPEGPISVRAPFQSPITETASANLDDEISRLELELKRR